ncbi:TPA: helix-turn-helix domain-containing protein [Clostridium perfringens]|uniref:Helix-turn-helix domain-containing protein n=1 Tax=Clostridium perfringens TaxID=1502 RepID=A0AAW9K1V5_CLOPF|nr:helix-turn-helix transcriptional regulator [Clostridium perfringens]MDK0616151.1 helix-turn-helix transcriptional regulator [Clostridium perfringens]MDZ4949190.1 helix-turn-helix domain-containing protein [Clostridium perfringens]MDZ7542187.1 helix-turn-helix domain-containing protein [Clostridium perfringens]
MKKINLKIKYYRELKKISQSELAKSTGLSKSYISELESGKKICSLKTLFNIGESLDVCPLVLIERFNLLGHQNDTIQNKKKIK